MILTDTDILSVIEKRPNKKIVEAAQDYTKKILMHVKGVGLDDYISKIDAFEKEDILKIRKKYAVSNKAIFSRLHRPIDKVFSAKGGSCYYNLPEKQEKALREALKNVTHGFSLRKWLETFWVPALSYDPMGLVFIEVDANGVAYPTYKSILDIFEMKLNYRKVEYVIFKIDDKVSKEQNFSNGSAVYRVVDDIVDRLIYIDNGLVIDVHNQTYPNYFLQVPAMTISDIYEPVKGMFISSDDEIIELADQFLREGSVKNIFKAYFGFPEKWEYQSACPECNGEGVLNGRTCDFCKGTKIRSKRDVSETLRIPVPQTKDQPILAPNLSGFSTPDIKGWDKMTEELDLLEDLMFQTQWGTHQLKKAENQTATGKFIDTQPVNDRLNKYSDSLETMETFCTDLIGSKLLGQSYQGASITAGRRYMIETPDEIWDKLQKAIIGGAPHAALCDLYNDYLQARYSSNSLEMQKLIKLSRIEPLPFVKYENFGRLQQFPDEIIQRKFWFEVWLNQKSDPEILSTDLKILQKDFEEFCEANIVPVVQPGAQGTLGVSANPNQDNALKIQQLQEDLDDAEDPAEKERIQGEIEALTKTA